MKCAWQAYLNLLPLWMRKQVDNLGRDTLQELRLRIGRVPELVMANGSQSLERIVTGEDLRCCVNAASQYSPWSSMTVSDGFITAPGGHRLGICGEVAMVNGKISTVSHVTSLCIRVARDFPGIGMQTVAIPGSLLIIGSPGRGKTTLLRDIIRQKSNAGTGAVAVVDERRELFPIADGAFCFPPGFHTEVMSGCSKPAGMEMLIRTMNPSWIAVDEITASEDCQALIHGGWCGVSMLATAHAENMQDLLTRPVYKPVVQCGIFQNVIVMQKDKSWVLERINGCI